MLHVPSVTSVTSSTASLGTSSPVALRTASLPPLAASSPAMPPPQSAAAPVETAAASTGAAGYVHNGEDAAPVPPPLPPASASSLSRANMAALESELRRGLKRRRRAQHNAHHHNKQDPAEPPCSPPQPQDAAGDAAADDVDRMAASAVTGAVAVAALCPESLHSTDPETLQGIALNVEDPRETQDAAAVSASGTGTTEPVAVRAASSTEFDRVSTMDTSAIAPDTTAAAASVGVAPEQLPQTNAAVSSARSPSPPSPSAQSIPVPVVATQALLSEEAAKNDTAGATRMSTPPPPHESGATLLPEDHHMFRREGAQLGGDLLADFDLASDAPARVFCLTTNQTHTRIAVGHERGVTVFRLDPHSASAGAAASSAEGATADEARLRAARHHGVEYSIQTSDFFQLAPEEVGLVAALTQRKQQIRASYRAAVAAATASTAGTTAATGEDSDGGDTVGAPSARGGSTSPARRAAAAAPLPLPKRVPFLRGSCLPAPLLPYWPPAAQHHGHSGWVKGSFARSSNTSAQAQPMSFAAPGVGVGGGGADDRRLSDSDDPATQSGIFGSGSGGGEDTTVIWGDAPESNHDLEELPLLGGGGGVGVVAMLNDTDYLGVVGGGDSGHRCRRHGVILLMQRRSVWRAFFLFPHLARRGLAAARVERLPHNGGASGADTSANACDGDGAARAIHSLAAAQRARLARHKASELKAMGRPLPDGPLESDEEDEEDGDAHSEDTTDDGADGDASRSDTRAATAARAALRRRRWRKEAAEAAFTRRWEVGEPVLHLHLEQNRIFATTTSLFFLLDWSGTCLAIVPTTACMTSAALRAVSARPPLHSSLDLFAPVTPGKLPPIISSFRRHKRKVKAAVFNAAATVSASLISYLPTSVSNFARWGGAAGLIAATPAPAPPAAPVGTKPQRPERRRPRTRPQLLEERVARGAGVSVFEMELAAATWWRATALADPEVQTLRRAAVLGVGVVNVGASMVDVGPVADALCVFPGGFARTPEVAADLHLHRRIARVERASILNAGVAASQNGSPLGATYAAGGAYYDAYDATAAASGSGPSGGRANRDAHGHGGDLSDSSADFCDGVTEADVAAAEGGSNAAVVYNESAAVAKLRSQQFLTHARRHISGLVPLIREWDARWAPAAVGAFSLVNWSTGQLLRTVSAHHAAFDSIALQVRCDCTWLLHNDQQPQLANQHGNIETRRSLVVTASETGTACRLWDAHRGIILRELRMWDPDLTGNRPAGCSVQRIAIAPDVGWVVLFVRTEGNLALARYMEQRRLQAAYFGAQAAAGTGTPAAPTAGRAPSVGQGAAAPQSSSVLPDVLASAATMVQQYQGVPADEVMFFSPFDQISEPEAWKARIVSRLAGGHNVAYKCGAHVLLPAPTVSMAAGPNGGCATHVYPQEDQIHAENTALSAMDASETLAKTMSAVGTFAAAAAFEAVAVVAPIATAAVPGGHNNDASGALLSGWIGALAAGTHGTRSSYHQHHQTGAAASDLAKHRELDVQCIRLSPDAVRSYCHVTFYIPPIETYGSKAPLPQPHLDAMLF